MSHSIPRSFPRPAPLALAIALALCGGVAWAQAPDASPRQITLAAQPLGDALNAWARQAGVQLAVPQALVAGKTAPAVSGQLTPQQALDRLLAGSGLVAERQGHAVVVKAAPAAGPTSTLAPVTVTAAAERETATGPVAGYIARRTATASKNDTPIVEIPQSISVVTAERADAIGATRLRDALGYTPGVNISPYGSDSRFDWIFIRGFDAYTPGYYQDGMQLRNVFSNSLWMFESYGAERIEIMRGPSSVLYGQNSAGGMVNVVSKRPTAETHREVRLQLGENGHRQLAADFSGALDEEGKWLYRLTGLAQEAKLALSDLPDDRFYVAPALTWRPSSDTTLTLLASYLKKDAGSNYRSYPAVGTILPNPNGRISSNAFLGDARFNHYKQDQWMLGYLLEHRLSDRFTVRQNLRYAGLEQDYLGIGSFSSFLSVDPANPSDPANYRRVNRRFSGSTENARLFTVDSQLQASFQAGAWRHTVLVGLDHQRTHYDVRAISGGTLPAIDVYSLAQTGNTFALPSTRAADYVGKPVQTGLYVQDQIRFTDRWVATIGGRLDKADSETVNRRTIQTTKHSDSKFSGRAGLVYLHPAGWAPYASYSESFVPSTTVDPATGELFKPETGQQYEAGIRYQPPGGKDSYSAAIFELKRQNYVTFDAQSVPRQTGEITVRGLELEAGLQPVSGMHVLASYTWIPSADVTASSAASAIGKQLNPVSEHQASLWGDYRFGNGIKVGLGVRHVGSNYGTNEFLKGSGKVPAHTLFDALVGYEIERWHLALNVRNLTNKSYVSSCGYGSCYYGDPRKVIGTATYRW